MSLIELERTFRESLENEATVLTELRDAIRANSPLSRDGNEITKAVLLRMKSYYDGQNKIKALLNKRYLSAASDFFVESVLFYLKLFCEFHAGRLQVHSERQIKKKRGSIRPDISVWAAEDVVAIIECKTQLGWNRDKWDADFQRREAQLKKDFPAARAYLLVMTSENWGGFPEGDGRVGQQFFTLSSIWPTNITTDNLDQVIVNPIERLFNAIIAGHNGA
jgi:hypothetical protein